MQKKSVDRFCPLGLNTATNPNKAYLPNRASPCQRPRLRDGCPALSRRVCVLGAGPVHHHSLSSFFRKAGTGQHPEGGAERATPGATWTTLGQHWVLGLLLFRSTGGRCRGTFPLPTGPHAMRRCSHLRCPALVRLRVAGSFPVLLNFLQALYKR